MVICQYFLSNNCHFKNNCKNEHIDVRTQIKQEMEAAIKGKQWPLSCFGPFKEKTNLIPGEADKSFEEVRLECAMAKANNTFHIYQQQLLTKIQEANAQMQTIFNVNRDVLNAVVNIYNEDTPNPQQKAAFNSSFGSNSTTSTGQSSAFSIFGAGSNSTTSTTPSAASIFGASPSRFGGASTQNQTANSIFGAGSAANNNTTTFGGQPNASSIFGGGNSTFGSNNPATTFGASTMQNNTGSSIFGASTFGSAQPQVSSGSIFGQSSFSKPPQPSAFGSPASGFGTFSQPTETSPFTANQTSFSTPSTFGASSNVFGNSQPQNTTFGMQSSFGPSPANSSANSSSFFGSNQSSVIQNPLFPNQSGTFGQQPAANNTFNSQPQGFGNQSFASPATSSPTTFGSFSTTPAAPSFAPTTTFGMTPEAVQSVQQQPQQQPQGLPQSEDNPLYTKMQDLTAEQLAAFQADEFVLGKIPNVPPPRELCF